MENFQDCLQRSPSPPPPFPYQISSGKFPKTQKGSVDPRAVSPSGQWEQLSAWLQGRLAAEGGHRATVRCPLPSPSLSGSLHHLEVLIVS